MINLQPSRYGEEISNILLHDLELGLQILLSRWAADALLDLLPQSSCLSFLQVEPGARTFPGRES
jgi:hypothetical protein